MSQEQTKEYEILYFVSATLEDEAIKEIKNKVNEILNKHQTTIIKEDNLGKHKLAYMIKRARHGYFILITFSALTTEIAAINHELKLMPEVLRYKLAIKQKNTTAAAKNKLESNDSKNLTPLEEKQAIPSNNKEKIIVKKSTPEKKVDSQELDRKIDELLADDNI